MRNGRADAAGEHAMCVAGLLIKTINQGIRRRLVEALDWAGEGAREHDTDIDSVYENQN